MSLKAMKAELRRLSAQVGLGEERELLIVLATVCTAPDEMDYPDFAGHYMSYPIEGAHQSFHFPFSKWTSEQAEDLAMNIVMHTIQTESLNRRRPPAILDMKFFSDPKALTLTPPPEGVSMAKHAADAYQKVIEVRHESA